MRGRRAKRIEAAVDHGAAAVLGGAVGFALFLLLPNGMAQQGRLAAAASVAVVVFWLATKALRRVGADKPQFVLRPFEFPELHLDEVEELVLTDADRLKQTIAQLADELVLTDADRLHPASDELVLDDILAELGPDSRVVRLFDPAAMPTPGQLNARIERHLRGTPSPAAPADASQALYEALSELKRSLR
jgi:hypothetical protein